MTMESTQTPPEAADLHGTAPQPEMSQHKRNLRIAQQALIDEFHALIDDTERLLKHTAEVTGSQADEVRARINDNLTRAREVLKDGQGRLYERGQAVLETTEEYVHAHPWRSVGIAAGAGLLLGLLLGRR